MNKSRQEYTPSYLSWTKSYEQEEREMRELILGGPGDVAMLKKEYEQLTGKRFRKRKGE